MEEVMVDISEIGLGPVRHQPFDEETREKFRHLQRVLDEVHPMTATEWELGFRRDTNPHEEIDWWLQLAEFYQQLTADVTSRAAKKEFLRALVFAGQDSLAGVRKRCSLFTHAEFHQFERAIYPNGPERSILYKPIVIASGPRPPDVD